jgi:hypothetical protein
MTRGHCLAVRRPLPARGWEEGRRRPARCGAVGGARSRLASPRPAGGLRASSEPTARARARGGAIPRSGVQAARLPSREPWRPSAPSAWTEPSLMHPNGHFDASKRAWFAARTWHGLTRDWRFDKACDSAGGVGGPASSNVPWRSGNCSRPEAAARVKAAKRRRRRAALTRGDPSAECTVGAPETSVRSQ